MQSMYTINEKDINQLIMEIFLLHSWKGGLQLPDDKSSLPDSICLPVPRRTRYLHGNILKIWPMWFI